LLALVTACGHLPTAPERGALAANIAATAQLQRQDRDTPFYTLAAWQRLTAPGKAVHVYIEGDGLAWLTRHDPSPDPTPTNPVALRLATADTAPNVVYLARPCQYVRDNRCGEADWTGARFSKDILAAYNAALDRIAVEMRPPGFDLIGFSGGANVAGLLAESRRDIASLRTVSGDIDNHAFIALHHLSPMPLSLDMADNAQKISRLPQRHFIGRDDAVIIPAVAASFQKRMGASSCFAVETVPDAGHEEGWQAIWPALLEKTPSCKPVTTEGKD
jgi:hypothetical protein